MFEDLKSLIAKAEKTAESPLTSLNLRTPAPPPAPKEAAAEPGKQPVQHRCSMLNLNPEGQKAFAAEFQRRYQEWLQTGPRPVRLFFGVLPQQGQPITGATQDGKHTLLFLFDTPMAARAFVAKVQPSAAIAGLPVSSLFTQADKWKIAGINAFTLNACPICNARNLFPIKNVESHEEFEKSWVTILYFASSAAEYSRSNFMRIWAKTRS